MSIKICLTFIFFNVSLFKWGGYSKTKAFVGLENYKILFTDRRFFDSLKNHPALLSIEQIDYLEDFLTQADLVKFACFRAAPEQLAKAIDRAGKLIDETSGNTNNTNSATSMEQVK